MILYSPNGAKVNADEFQVKTLLEAGFAKEMPKKQEPVKKAPATASTKPRAGS